MPETIYLIHNPHDPTTVYVGRTSRDIQARLKEHIASDEPWFVKMRYTGIHPTVELLEENLDDFHAWVQEQDWIRRYKAQGFTMVNVAYNRPHPWDDWTSEEMILGHKIRKSRKVK